MTSADARHPVVGGRPACSSAAGVILVGVVALAAILGGGRSPGIAVVSPSPVSQRIGYPAGQATATPVPSDGTSLVPVVDPGVDPGLEPSTRRHRDGYRTTRSPLRPGPRRRLEPTIAQRPSSARTPGPTATLAGPTATSGRRSDRRRRPRSPASYTVKKGDTIKSIATKFGLKPRDLRAVNDIGKDVVVGQRLRIPARSVSPP